MTKIFLILCLIINACICYGTEKDVVVLLTSVKNDKVDIALKLEKIFRNKLKGTSLKLKIIHQADQQFLNAELEDENNLAVFWVSHGAFLKMRGLNSTSGIAPVNMIIDFNGDNVAPVFQKIHPGLNFIGIIGCNSKQILSSYLENNFWSTDAIEAPMEYVSRTKAIAQFALRRALKKFLKAYKNNKLPNRNIQNFFRGYPIRISMTMPENIPVGEIRAIRVMHSGQFIGIIPKILPGKSIVKTFHIPEQVNYKRQNFELVLTTGESIYKDKSKIHFGKIQIEAANGSDWSIFSKPNGEPFGVNTRIFQHRGGAEILESLEEIDFKSF